MARGVALAIVGSREFLDKAGVEAFVRRLKPTTTVVSGGARGVDRWAAEAAKARGLPVIEYFAEWERFGKRAGFIRNEQIVERADYVVAFWDEKSPGTEHTICLAAQAKKLWCVFVSRQSHTVMAPELGLANKKGVAGVAGSGVASQG